MILNSKNSLSLPISYDLKLHKKRYPKKLKTLFKKKPILHKYQHPSLSVAIQPTLQNAFLPTERIFHLPDAIPKEKLYFDHSCNSERVRKDVSHLPPIGENEARESKKYITNLKELILHNYASDNSKVRKPKSFRTINCEQDEKLPTIEESQLGITELIITRIPFAVSNQITPREHVERAGKSTARQQTEPPKYKVFFIHYY